MTPIALTLLLLTSTAFLGAKGAPKPEELNLSPLYLAQLDSGRIINGQTAEKGQFPHQIGLFKNGQFTCGGSIISQTFILTAAHCIVDPGTYTVRAGSIFRLVEGQTYQVKKYIRHPEYIGKPDYFRNDVGLVELATPLALSPEVKIIPLERSPAQPGQVVTTSGWGRTIPDNPHSLANILQYLMTTVVSEIQWPPHPGQFGALASKGQGICFGDSGGPVITQQDTLIGVNSFVQTPCASGKADGFAHVPHYISWIQQYVQ